MVAAGCMVWGLGAEVASVLLACSPSQGGCCNMSHRVTIPSRKVDERGEKATLAYHLPESGSSEEPSQITHAVFQWLLLCNGGWGQSLLEGYGSAVTNTEILFVKEGGVGRQLLSLPELYLLIQSFPTRSVSEFHPTELCLFWPHCFSDYNIIIHLEIWRVWFLLLHSIELAYKFAEILSF